MNFDRWKHLIDPDRVAMDWRHVQMIHSVLVSERPESIVEIGTFWGFSSTAIVEAVEQCPEIKRATFVDMNYTPQFKDCILPALNQQEGLQFSCYTGLSSEFSGSGDCWIIDGDHHQYAVMDYGLARRNGAKIIIAHDTNPNLHQENNWGSIQIGKIMLQDAVCVFNDCKYRGDDEHTDRGLSIAFYQPPKPETYEALKKLAE